MAVRTGDSGRSGAPVAGAPPGAGSAVEVRRSRRRRRTVTAYRDGERTVVCIPARFSRAEEADWVERMLARLAAQDRRRRPGDGALTRRAAELSERYLDGRARPHSVRWVANQRSRWGSTTPTDGTIRLSTRLRGMPGWVLDYVLLHELAHLLEPGHGPEFWALLEAYPRTERARGYLEGVAAARDLPADDAEAVEDALEDVDEVDCAG
jgi:hypothetical protein